MRRGRVDLVFYRSIVPSRGFLLQQQHAVEQRLRRRRAARHLDVHRHDAIAAADHRVGMREYPPPLAHQPIEMTWRLWHLVVDLAERRRILLVRCPRRSLRRTGEARRRRMPSAGVVTRHRHLDHLAAQQAGRKVIHMRAGAGPVDEHPGAARSPCRRARC